MKDIIMIRKVSPLVTLLEEIYEKIKLRILVTTPSKLL